MTLHPTLRKAAILISSLDARSADALLEQMGEAQAQRVRDAIMTLDDINPLEQERIINEFLGGRVSLPADDGVELGGSLAQTLHVGASRLSEPSQRSPSEKARVPFAFLHEASGDLIARHLLREHPQTIAVVLAHLPPARAAAVVRHFPTEIQADVLLRVGDIDEMPMDVVHEVERGLEAAIVPEIQAARKRGSGAATLEAILTAAKETGGLLASAPKIESRPHAAIRATPAALTRQAPALGRQSEKAGESPRAPVIEFAQLSRLDDNAWAKILRVADAQVSLLALAGASADLVERLLRQLAPRDAHILQRKMETLGPVRLRDIEHAQQQLARIAVQLAAQGELHLPQPRRFATAA